MAVLTKFYLILNFDLYFSDFFILSKETGEESKLYLFTRKAKTFLRKLKLNFKSFGTFHFFGVCLYYKNGKEFLLDA